jgi:pimeloyl-ACP methyl ester carboxylesterase
MALEAGNAAVKRKGVRPMSKRRTIGLLVSLFLTPLALFGCGSDDDESGPRPQVLPVVFVHGQSGSAQQFESQAMRFTSNGYPADVLFAFEYSTAVSENPLGDLDAFIADVLASTGAAQIYAVGHSRGTSVWTEYLKDPAFDGPSLVSRYVNIAIFAYDDGSDGVTDLEKGELSPFSGITFLTAADLYLRATPDGGSPIEVVLVTRGSGEKRIYVPNRPSTLDRNTVMFRDDTQ